MTAFRAGVRLYRHASTLHWVKGEDLSRTFCDEMKKLIVGEAILRLQRGQVAKQLRQAILSQFLRDYRQSAILLAAGAGAE